MKQNFDVHRDVWGPYFTLLLNISHDSTFIHPSEGTIPGNTHRTVPESKLTKDGIFLELLQELPPDYEKIEHFDMSADEYQMATHKFKAQFWDSAFEIIRSQVFPDFYILEAACGPGHEAIKLNTLVPDGEIIVVDLSTKMIKRAYRNARLEKIANMGFVQADVHQLPVSFKQHFDLVFCSLSLHFFKNVEQVLKQFYWSLRSGGKVVIVEPWGFAEQVTNAPLLKMALPQFQRFYSADELKALLQHAGFNSQFWKGIQKDIGLTIAVKH